MAMPDYIIRDRLPELWRQIDNTHLSYLETDDSPEKLDQRKKLEGYILDYLCLVTHEHKFCLPETLELMSKSALAPDFSGYRLARGWVALARYAANLLAQPWRKEYHTIRLYSGFYKHEVEGSGLVSAERVLGVMGYRPDGTPHSLALDGPVCPDQVAAVSRDSLIAYVECQIMIQIKEEVTLRGGNCTWLEVLNCREICSGDVDQAATVIMYAQKNPKDIYSNVKFPSSSPHLSVKKSVYQSPMSNENLMQTNSNTMPTHNAHIQQIPVQPKSNGVIQNGHESCNLPTKAQIHNVNNGQDMIVNNIPDHHGMYCTNSIIPTPHMEHMNGINRGPLELNPVYRYNSMGMMNQYTPMPGYYYHPMMANPYIMQPPLTPYGAVRQATTLPLTNGYHCPSVPQQAYCPSVPTGQLIELDIPTYPTNNRSHHVCPTMSSPKQNHNSPSDRTKTDSVQTQRDSHKKLYSNSVDSRTNASPAVNNTIKKVHDSNGETQESIRRNSAPRSSASYSTDQGFTIPRSDTQPSLSKAREDGMGTFESWDYVFRNLESQGYSKDLGERGNILSPPLERDSKTLGRIGNRDSKRYQPTTMDLEDALHAMSLEKDSDEELYRTAKINETLLKIKQENESKTARANMKRQILADEREKRKSNSCENSQVTAVTENNAYSKVNDKTRLISKEDAKDKKEIDKSVYVNGNSNKTPDSRKVKKSIVKCLSSENDNVKKKTSLDHSTSAVSTVKKTQNNFASTSSNHYHTTHSQDNVDSGIKTRLVVALHEPENPGNGYSNSKASSHEPHTAKTSEQKSPRSSEQHKTKTSEQGGKHAEGKSSLWECGTCTFVNKPERNACEMCSKSRQVGVEALPLMSGGKECPLCTLVNKREATVCAACDTSLKHSPTYI